MATALGEGDNNVLIGIATGGSVVSIVAVSCVLVDYFLFGELFYQPKRFLFAVFVATFLAHAFSLTAFADSFSSSDHLLNHNHNKPYCGVWTTSVSMLLCGTLYILVGILIYILVCLKKRWTRVRLAVEVEIHSAILIATAVCFGFFYTDCTNKCYDGISRDSCGQVFANNAIVVMAFMACGYVLYFYLKYEERQQYYQRELSRHELANEMFLPAGDRRRRTKLIELEEQILTETVQPLHNYPVGWVFATLGCALALVSNYAGNVVLDRTWSVVNLIAMDLLSLQGLVYSVIYIFLDPVVSRRWRRANLISEFRRRKTGAKKRTKVGFGGSSVYQLADEREPASPTAADGPAQHSAPYTLFSDSDMGESQGADDSGHDRFPGSGAAREDEDDYDESEHATMIS